MILYSIIPPEIIFNTSEVTATKEISYLGERVMVVPLENNKARIERIISTSPKAYLNPGLMPGSIISL